MTPIYRSPDREQTLEMQALLEEHHIPTSVIETKKSGDVSSSTSVVWYELWLRSLGELARARTIITQHEFTTYRTNMSSYRTSVVDQKKYTKYHDNKYRDNGYSDGRYNDGRYNDGQYNDGKYNSIKDNGNRSSNSEYGENTDLSIAPSTMKTTTTVSIHEKTTAETQLIPSPVVAQPSNSNPFLSKPSSDVPFATKSAIAGQPRESLIPINNKRVFKRLGLLLGFTEEEIQKYNNNKLYRPWDAAELNESVKKLKQKCS